MADFEFTFTYRKLYAAHFHEPLAAVMLFSWCDSQQQRKKHEGHTHATSDVLEVEAYKKYRLCITNANKMGILVYLLKNREKTFGYHLIKTLITFPCKHFFVFNPVL